MDFFEKLITKEKKEIMMMSPLTWAYVGDSVYEQYIRLYLSNKTNLNPHKMHILAIKYVKASSQSDIVKKLCETILKEEEIDIVKMGRNTQTHHTPKNASIADYAYSTGFESLIGYLYLIKNSERLEKILEEVIKIVEEK